MRLPREVWLVVAWQACEDATSAQPNPPLQRTMPALRAVLAAERDVRRLEHGASGREVVKLMVTMRHVSAVALLLGCSSVDAPTGGARRTSKSAALWLTVSLRTLHRVLRTDPPK
jgi:hypothetical protein